MTDATRFEFMHTMVRVNDLERSLDFYTRLLGMRVLLKREFPESKFTLAFVGYGPMDTHPGLELTYNWDRTEPYEIGNGYGHIAFGVRDLAGVCAKLEAEGARIPRKPGPMLHGTTHLAFVEDPDGYRIELIDLDTVEKIS